ncbi:MAG: hypothetical protein QOE33_3275 [Acidobacteriota bacterium]|nr:hypothetical protein [Acidobacteriota bacterium]
MANRNAATATRKRRRLMTLAWSAAVAAVVIGLIWKEQIALLYILATVSVTALLVVVAMADLGGARRTQMVAPYDDSAAAADGATPDAPRSSTRKKRA